MFQSSPTIDPIPIVGALASIRKEWQDAAFGDSLLSIEGNVGLILADLINGLGLPVDVQVEILGADLFREMQDLLTVSSQQ
jgi:hypothetical protein